MSDAMIGYGAKFAIGDGASPEVFDELAEVISITPPSDTIDVVDVTHLQSPDRTREFLAGLRDPGECSFEMNFIPGSDADGVVQGVRDNGGVPVNCRVTFPNGVTWTFSGILTGYEPTVPLEDKMTATVTFKVTGSYTTGTAA